MSNLCPFEVGEIAVFRSHFRFETYISRVTWIHVEYWGTSMVPEMIKATPEQKRLWFENGEDELIIEDFFPKHLRE